MIARASRRAPLLLSIGLTAAFSVSCEKVPLLAPSGSTITLTAATNALPANGSAQIVAQVLEAAGTPPHSGTHVIFTTTLGNVEPSEAKTDINGRVTVTFVAGGINGTARITASSGGATSGADGAITIAVGTAAVGRVIVDASPATVPATGGSTSITARVLDINGNLLTAAPVSFSTDAGTLSSTLASTDENGVAQTTLTTGREATVTATVGPSAPPSNGDGGETPGTPGQNSGSVTVSIAAAPTVNIEPPTTPPSAGLPASFTITVAVAAENGSAIRDVRVNWGDGDSQNLGAVTGTAVVSHVYDSAGSYNVTVTATDASDNSTSVSTAVTVIPVPRPTIIVTPSPANPLAGNSVTFTIQITAVPGIGIQSTTIDFGDGSSQELGGASSASVPHVYTTPGTRTVTVTVEDTSGQITIGTTSVSVS